jgi:hypothetical protein
MPDPRRHDTIEQPVSAEQKRINVLLATVEALTRDNEELRTRQAKQDTSPEWRALKSCNSGAFTYECLRRWCVSGLIIAEKRRGRWYVNVASLNARLAELTAFHR